LENGDSDALATPFLPESVACYTTSSESSIRGMPALEARMVPVGVKGIDGKRIELIML
jgi:hypothetical protein